MISSFASRITEALCASSVIEEGDKELYTYGFFILLSRILFYAVTVLCGFLFGVLWESMLFYIMFTVLRSYAGGVHANTETGCTVLTTLAMLVSVIEIRLLKSAQGEIVPMVLLGIGAICLFMFSPLDTAEKPLENADRQHYRNISIAITLVCLLAALWAYEAEKYGIVSAIAASIFLEGVLLITGKLHSHHCKKHQ